MRWIFFSLVAANLVVFVWGMVVKSPVVLKQREKISPGPYENYPKLRFLSEIDSARNEKRAKDRIQERKTQQEIEKIVAENIEFENLGRVSPTPEPKRVAVTTPKPKTNVVSIQESEPLSTPKPKIKLNSSPTPKMPVRSRPLCDLVGPFGGQQAANEFVSRLKAIEIESVVKNLELPNGRGYWVYLAPQPTRKKAQQVLRELLSKKIDSFVIPKGDLKNGISLGMYIRKDLAVSRREALAKRGLSPKLREVERTYREIWVMLEKKESDKMSDITWERVMEDTKKLERRQNYCLDVAS